MIGTGQFQAQITESEKLLRRLGMLEERNPSPNKRLGAAHFKGMIYREIYFECVKEFAFDFRLCDQSLILFVKDGSNEHDGLLGYSYYECPVNIDSYEEFVGAQFSLTPLDSGFDDLIGEVGDDLSSDYEQYVASADSKTIVTPLRYDYKAADYREGVHPASHIHFGFANEIRIGTRKVMNPLSFTLFIIRQRYPRSWEKVLALDEAHLLCRNVRDSLADTHSDYWKPLDLFEASLL